MSGLAQRIERHWYQPVWWMTALLAPLEGLFALLSALRRGLYRAGLLRAQKLPVPVVVIGNINVGGVGKTPLTLSLLRQFQAAGVPVGVISRGYGGNHAAPVLLSRGSLPKEVGDEPLLLAASGAPVAVGRDRVAAGRLLLARHPELRLILTDDGLQHYRLARDLEIAVLDGRRGVGNGRLLPGGPLREPVSRLRSVQAVVVNGGGAPAFASEPGMPPVFGMSLTPGRLHPLDPGTPSRPASAFSTSRVIAMAGIGHPERFFDTLKALGIAPQRELAFPDHHDFSAADLPEDADAILVTAKDAVKLSAVIHDATQRARLWVLPVTARLEPDLADWILTQLKIQHGR